MISIWYLPIRLSACAYHYAPLCTAQSNHKRVIGCDNLSRGGCATGGKGEWWVDIWNSGIGNPMGFETLRVKSA